MPVFRNNKTCIVCGENYTFCNSCEEFDMMPRWMAIYHNENCRNIFITASNYEDGHLTKQQAREEFDKCDLSYRNKLHENIQKDITEVYAETNDIPDYLANITNYNEMEETPKYGKRKSKKWTE